MVVNKHLLHDLVNEGLWNLALKDKIVAANGSVQNIKEIPEHLRELYRTAWEIKQKTIIDMAADRGAFICQSQSMNVFMTDVNFAKLTSMHFYAWKAGLKTGMYYLRTKAAAQAVKFTVSQHAEPAVGPSPVPQPQAEPQLVDVVASEGSVHVGASAQALQDLPAGPTMSIDEARAQMTCSLDNPDACEACGS